MSTANIFMPNIKRQEIEFYIYKTEWKGTVHEVSGLRNVLL